MKLYTAYWMWEQFHIWMWEHFHIWMWCSAVNLVKDLKFFVRNKLSVDYYMNLRLCFINLNCSYKFQHSEVMFEQCLQQCFMISQWLSNGCYMLYPCYVISYMRYVICYMFSYMVLVVSLCYSCSSWSMCIHVHNPFLFIQVDGYKKTNKRKETNPTSWETGCHISTREKTNCPLDYRE